MAPRSSTRSRPSGRTSPSSKPPGSLRPKPSSPATCATGSASTSAQPGIGKLGPAISPRLRRTSPTSSHASCGCYARSEAWGACLPAQPLLTEIRANSRRPVHDGARQVDGSERDAAVRARGDGAGDLSRACVPDGGRRDRTRIHRRHASTHHETSEPLTRNPDGGDNEELVVEDIDGVEWLESQLVPATTADDEAGQDRGSR